MEKYEILRKCLALTVILCPLLPGTTFGGDRVGKKNFNEGMKCETRQQWDLAANHFALAVATEPDNPEYRLHLLHALQDSAIMFLRRGDAFAEQNDYARAYVNKRPPRIYRAPDQPVITLTTDEEAGVRKDN